MELVEVDFLERQKEKQTFSLAVLLEIMTPLKHLLFFVFRFNRFSPARIACTLLPWGCELKFGFWTGTLTFISDL